MRRDSFLSQVLRAVARSTPATDPVRGVAADLPSARPVPEFLIAIARATPAFTSGGVPALDTKALAQRQPEPPPTGSPDHATKADDTGDLIDFGRRISAIHPGRSYRQALVVAVAAMAIPVIVATILVIKTATHFNFGSAPVRPVGPVGSTLPPTSPSDSATGSPTTHPGSPTQFDTLMAKIPPAIRAQPNPAGCRNPGTQFNATAVIQCQNLQGAAQVIIYYLYPSRTTLASGLSDLLTAAKFRKIRECTTGNSSFTDFRADCQSDYTIKTPALTGSIAEYTNGTQVIIVSTDNDQHVMAVLVGTNAGELLAYWNQQQWIVTGS